VTDPDLQPTSEEISSAKGSRKGLRRVLAAASSGGHFKQLVRLVERIPDVGEITWLTYDRGPTGDLLAAAGRADDHLVHAPYAAPRDVPNLLRNARIARALLRRQHYDLAVSTGAGIAVATLPAARAKGVRSVFIESATRAEGPSMSGRILQRMPGIELYTQNPGYPRRWGTVGSVHDEFQPGPAREAVPLRRVVVTLGTIQPYGFRRLVERLLEVLPGDAEVLWQTGATETSGLPISGREVVPAPELHDAISAADVVVAHAGTGTAMTAFELGRTPVLVPRRHEYDEHVDDHQVITARSLAARGLAVHAEVDQLDLGLLQHAAQRSVIRRDHVPVLDL
jgi:UDP-N-acetylglucosamine--N-acetylmuramyl-(pentapeptide) pyrophosphoryl-undecaprenol N-acetylglucosamine transferase